MKLSLKNFEREIDPTILKRGLDYYKEGRVTPMTELTHKGETEFSVDGTEPYEVTVTLDGDEVTDYSCDCPYDWEPVCKHVVASLYYLAKGGYIDLNSKTIAHPTSKAKIKKSFTKTDVERLLNTLSYDELKDFVRDICASHRDIRQAFISSHINLVMPVSTQTYLLQIDELLNACTDRDGFVEWSRIGQIVDGLHKILEEAQKAAEKKDWQGAFCRIKAIIEKAETLFDSCDDSEGDISVCIEETLDFLLELNQNVLPESFRKELLAYCLDCFKRNILSDLDLNWYFAECAVDLSKDKSECDKLEPLLNSVDKSDENQYRHALDIRLQIVGKWGGKDESTRFMQTHVDNPDFRKSLIHQAMDVNDYEKVIQLTNDGIKHDEKEWPGLADDWRDYQLQAYVRMNDTHHIVKMARYFLMEHTARYYNSEYYYKLLKENVPADKWQDTIQHIISELKTKRFPNIQLIMRIYEWEEDWQNLFDCLKGCATLSGMESAEPLLAKRYGDEFISLYADLVRAYLKNNMGRKYYQEACRYLRRMKKLGAKDTVESLIAGFRKKYSNRRALLEELSRV